MSQRPTTAQRGYGYRHEQVRRALLARWQPGDPCARCGQPMWYRWMLDRYGRRVSAIDLGHNDDRTGWTGLEHRRCNRGAPRRGKRFPLQTAGWASAREW
jgi:hypothetical protein